MNSESYVNRMKICLIKGNQKGFSLAESLVALAILGLSGAALIGGLMTLSKTTPLADEQSTAQNLAENQMEYVCVQDYDFINDPPQYELISDIPEGYSITNTANRLDLEGDGTDDDDGIQRIVVVVTHHGETVNTLETNRIRR
ncbi:MAG: type II secretion system protein [Chloroflexi bacterium]|nr:type II secretion system protein [Chloroflexota bacterium]